jgi:hypothetical protein
MKQNEKLSEERYENISKEMLKYKEKNKLLQEENSALRIKSKSRKENYETTRSEIENTIKLLEIREQDVENKILQTEVVKRSLYSRIYSLEDELKGTHEKLRQFIGMNDELNQLLEHETVPLSQYQEVQSQYQQLQSSSSEISSLATQLKSSSTAYDQLTCQYTALQSQYDDLRHQHDVIKESSDHDKQLIHDIQKKLLSSRTKLKESEIKNNLLLERIESYNLELKENQRIQIQEEERYQQICQEYQCCNEIRLEQEQALRSQDTEMNSLRIIIGNLKQMLTKESQQRGKPQTSYHESETKPSQKKNQNQLENKCSPTENWSRFGQGHGSQNTGKRSLSHSHLTPPFTPLVESRQNTMNTTPTKKTFITQDLDLSTPSSGLSVSSSSAYVSKEEEEEEMTSMTRQMKDQLDQHENDIKHFRQQLKHLELNYLSSYSIK